MPDQDQRRNFAWKLTYADDSHQHKIINYEEYIKCKTARVTKFPSGKIVRSEPEYVPPNCPG